MKTWNLPSAAAAAVLMLLATRAAEAIPAFAREHRLSCSVCHDPFPRLKPFGEEFAGNGFYLPEDDPDRNYVPAGDPDLRLLRAFPLAVRLDAALLYAPEQDGADWDLQAPWALKLLSGGVLARNIGYYFYFYMSEHGEVAGAEDAYLHFNDLFGQPLDIMVGQFQTSDPLMKRELRLTYEDYLIYKLRVGDSRTNLAYDRGVMVTYDSERTATGLVGMVFNGNGIGEAENGTYDRDNSKGLAVRLTQSIVPAADVGGFFFHNDENLVHGSNTVSYWGLDATIGVDRFALTAQFLAREDTHPLPGSRDRSTSGVVAELVFSPRFDRSRYYVTALYNQVDSDLNAHDYESITGSVTYLASRNLRLNAEYTRVTGSAESKAGYDRACLSVVSAF